MTETWLATLTMVVHDDFEKLLDEEDESYYKGSDEGGS
jgi:hypothetical protein